MTLFLSETPATVLAHCANVGAGAGKQREKVIMTQNNIMTNEEIHEIRRKVAPYVADPRSKLGKERINDPEHTHVREVWEDGEITSTKCGDLYRKRSLHRMYRPIWSEGRNILHGIPVGEVTNTNYRKIILDGGNLHEVLEEFR